jgi:hypothetical protein
MLMLPFEPTICLYHAPCTDGLVAAAIVRRRYPGCLLVPVNYQTALPSVSSLMLHNVLVVDFCPPEETLIEWSNIASNLLVLDHHPTTFSHPKLIVDETKCGASLVWDTLFDDRPRPWLVRHIHDYDLWRHELPDTHAIIAAVNSYPLDDPRWHGWIEDDEGYCLPALLIEGRALLRDEQRRLKDLKIRFTVVSKFLGFTVPVTNVVASDKAVINRLGDDLGARFPFSVFWSLDAAGSYHYSFRSSRAQADSVDVGFLAACLGGGGHVNAAGAVTRVSPSTLCNHLSVVSEWESVKATSPGERRSVAVALHKQNALR